MPVKKAAASAKKTVKSKTTSASKKEAVVSSAPKTRTAGLSVVPVYSLAGREAGSMTLPKEIFGVKVNKKLLSQALRVYSTNIKYTLGSTKTRGEVEGSTAKIYRQKGTGRARHGAVRAPIFVGGGIVFGPKPRKVRLNLPQAMKKAALLSALSAKASEKNVLAVSGLEKASGKTSEIAKLLKKLQVKSGLILIGDKSDTAQRAVRNLEGIEILNAGVINAYEVLKHKKLIVTKEGVEKLKV